MKRIFILFVLLVSSSICALADEILDVKLPPDYKIIVKNQDFPVTLRPHIKNGTFRVVNYQLFHKEKLISQVVENVQIINDNKVVLKYKTHDMHDPVHMNVNDWVNYSPYDELYQNMAETFYKYIMVHGKGKDYLVFMITYPNGSDHYPSYLIGYDKGNSKIILYSSGLLGDLRVLNPKDKNGEYELIDDKYINVPYFDGFFLYTLQYEIKDNTTEIVDKEYAVLHYNVFWFPEVHEVNIYSKPSVNSTVYKIMVDNKATVKILGIRFTEDNRFVHVIINGKEGWIEEGDSQYIGVGRAG